MSAISAGQGSGSRMRGWMDEQTGDIRHRLAGASGRAGHGLMQGYGFSGLEIASTRVFPEAPYDRPGEAAVWAARLKERHGLIIPSIQSIWYGRHEALFGTEKERGILLDHTRKAIDFAAAVGCRNLVFGCPKNRRLHDGADPGERAAQGVRAVAGCGRVSGICIH